MNLSEEFDFHGIGLRLNATASFRENVFLKLKTDFSFARQIINKEPEISIVLKEPSTSDGQNLRGVPLFKTPICRVYGKGRHRICDYGGGTQVHALNYGGKRNFEIFSEDENLLYEVAYTLILSSVGEALDLKGYHRVHGLGFSFKDLTYLLILPSGGGKSALATLLREKQGVKFFSDETPLIKKGVMYPFPLRVSMVPRVAQALGVEIKDKHIFKRKIYPEKILIPWNDSEVDSPRRLDGILVGKFIDPINGKPQISPAGQTLGLRGLVHSMVVGIGVAQMAEHMLRLNALGGLSRIGASRAKEAVISSLNSKSFSFLLGRDARENASVLEEFIDSRE